MKLVEELDWLIDCYDDAVNYILYREGIETISNLCGERMTEEEEEAIADDWKSRYLFSKHNLKRFCEEHPEYSCDELDLYLPNGEDTRNCATSEELFQFLEKNGGENE